MQKQMLSRDDDITSDTDKWCMLSINDLPQILLKTRNPLNRNMTVTVELYKSFGFLLMEITGITLFYCQT